MAVFKTAAVPIEPTLHFQTKEKPLASSKVSGTQFMFIYKLLIRIYYIRFFAKTTFSRICLSLNERMKSNPHSEYFWSDDS